MHSRRDFGRLALAVWPAAASLRAAKKIDSKVDGVQIGVQSYSFRDRPLDEAIAAMKEIGLGECELYQGHVEGNKRGEELKQWRLTVPLDTLKAIRRKFDDAGIQLFAYNISFNDNFSDEEIDRGFQMAEALGV
ncbi:MAG TPA: sugar phosphate isomerase/epimerase, partial [Bryobacteraceae bacterium]